MTIRTVYFDCDSTLVSIEGIDELGTAASPEVRQQLLKLTEAAMDGALPLDEVYPLRLDLLKPHREEIDALAKQYVVAMLSDAKRTVDKLREMGKTCGIISGGIRQAILPLAEVLGIPESRVHAVDLKFSEDGAYAGFDRSSPLWQRGGKKVLTNQLSATDAPACLIGDGATDLEAAPAIALFIGFGGVVKRPLVAESASHYIDGPGLGEVVDIVRAYEQIS